MTTTQHSCVVLAGFAVLIVGAIWLAFDDDQKDAAGSSSPTVPLPVEAPTHAEPRTRAVQVTTDMPERLEFLLKARTRTQLEVVAETLTPPLNWDALELLQYSTHICTLMGAESAASEDGYMALYERWVRDGRMAANPQTAMSFGEVEAFRRSHCDAYVDPALGRRDAVALERERESLAVAGSEAGMLREAIEALEAAEGADAPHEIEALANLALEARSPAVFREALDRLIEAEPKWIPPGLESWPGNPASNAGTARELGILLAYCHLMGNGCAAGSIIAIRHCMPWNCVPGETVENYLARSQASSQDMDEARRYATALLSWRRGGG